MSIAVHMWPKTPALVHATEAVAQPDQNLRGAKMCDFRRAALFLFGTLFLKAQID